MRLTSDEIAAIRDCAARHFGEGAVVRLFGSRVHDHLAGGDIDLHITLDREERATFHAEAEFKSALQHRIGEQRVDLLVNGPDGPTRPIEVIAVQTGIVLPDVPVGLVAAVERRPSKRIRALQELIVDALEAGRKTRARLLRVLEELTPKLPIDAEPLASLDWYDQLRTDSLLLQFNNMVAIVQDQLMRAVLIAAEEPVGRQSRIDQRNAAEKIGALPAGIDFRRIANARNEIAHQYPADEAGQARLVNEVAAAVPLAIEAFDVLAAYAETHVLRQGGPDAAP